MAYQDWLSQIARLKGKQGMCQMLGFTEAEYDALERVANDVLRGRYVQDRSTAYGLRLHFARWLVEQKRMGEWE